MIVRGVRPASDLIDQAVINVTPEDPGTEWVAGTYNTGDEVWKSSTHLVYRSAIDGNTDDPEIGVTKDPQTWVVIRSTNAYAMLNDIVAEQTEYADEIVLTYDSSSIDEIASGVALYNVDADEVQVVVTSGGSQVYDNTIVLNDYSNITGLYAYRYAPFLMRNTAFFDTWGTYVDAIVTVTIRKTGGTAKCGKLIVGENIAFGTLLAGAQTETKNIGATRTVNGQRQYVSEGVKKTIRGTIGIDTADADYVAKTVGDTLGNVAIGVSVDSRYDSMQTFGVISTTHVWLPTSRQKATFKVVSAV